MAAVIDQDAGYVALSRHLYWASEAGSRGAIGTRRLRDELLAFAWKARTDEQMLIPVGEPHLTSPARWRRRWKVVVFRLARFAFRRYDRMLAESGELAVALSERVVELESELDELRERLAALEGGRPPFGGPTR
jgi:hypothetical protein